jgi:hypothetical protein
MVNPNRFYTYAYLREDRTPYYIGKGVRYRLFEGSGKPCPVPKDKNRIIFLKQNLIEEEAFKHETYMISVFGRKIDGGILLNKTFGGEGASGRVVKDSTRVILKEKCSGWKHTPEAIEKIRQSSLSRIYSPKSEETKRKISNTLKGRKLSKELVDKRTQSVCKNTYVIISPDGVKYNTNNLKEFQRQNNLKHLYDVVSGKRKQEKGWTAFKI